MAEVRFPRSRFPQQFFGAPATRARQDPPAVGALQLAEVVMARRPKTPGSDPLADLAEKTRVLEEEMAIQRDAMQKLKAMGPDPYVVRDHDVTSRRKTA
jgi:hypothetical protein